MGCLFRLQVMVFISVALLAQNAFPASENFIKDIKSRSDSSGTTILITAVSPVEFLVYRLETPDRLAIEISNVQNSHAGDEINLEDDLIGEINAFYFEKARIWRLEIGLKTEVMYDASISGSTLSIAIEQTDDKNAKLEKNLSDSKETVDRLSAELSILQNKLQKKEAKKSRPKSSADQAEQPENIEHNQVDELKRFVKGWIEAWKNKDILRYSEYYAGSFVGRDMNKAEWLNSKREKFRNAASIDIRTEDFEAIVKRSRTVVRFKQHYSSDNYSDTGLKILIMLKENGEWRIRSERWRPLQ